MALDVDEALAASYEHCRRLNAAHGRTYYLATLLLPPQRRPAVHALYGFARYADDIVDAPGTIDPAAGLADWGGHILAGLRDGHSEDPIGRALVDAVRRYDLPVALFADFLDSMRTDLTVTDYPTYPDLERYMWGSAAVVGLWMLPVLGTVVAREEAAPYAVALGQAFQLTNFLRDVGEDLERGRIYLPAADLAAHGVTREHLQRRVVDGPVRRLLAAEVARTRALYAVAEPGIALLHPRGRDCVRTAFLLYRGILDEIEKAGYDVLNHRARVGRGRRAAVAAPRLARAFLTRSLPVSR